YCVKSRSTCVSWWSQSMQRWPAMAICSTPTSAKRSKALSSVPAGFWLWTMSIPCVKRAKSSVRAPIRLPPVVWIAAYVPRCPARPWTKSPNKSNRYCMPKITVLPHPDICPEGAVIENGAEGVSICRTLLDNHIEIEHACELSCACTTCHVVVRQGFDSLEEASD